MAKKKLQEVAPEPETVEVATETQEVAPEPTEPVVSTDTGTPEVQAANTTAPSVKAAFEVYNPGGALIRTYTVEQHGEDANKLANEFATKIGGKVV